MSNQSKEINRFFSLADRSEVDELLAMVILTERQYRIFEMKYIKGNDINFIADTIGLSSYAVDKELKKIRAKIAKYLERVASKKRRRVVLNGIEYPSVKEASVVTGHREYTIIKWCKRGYDVDGNPCRYADETQKEIPLVRQLHPHSASPKAVIVDGVRYETVQDGAKAIGTWSESIIRAIKENRKCKGHTCQYANQQPSRGNSDKSTSEGSTTNG